MTDVLPTEVPTEHLEDLEARLRDLDGALPHEFKSEIVDGGIQIMTPAGERHGRAAGNIFFSLAKHQRAGNPGRAYPDNVGYRVDLPGRGSFSPDTSYYTGAYRGADLIEDTPDFAVEVRSVGDYGPRAEARLARKRDDYFAAGTRVVWDVDLSSHTPVRAYRPDRPGAPDVFRRGEVADAEPAVPGWRFPVDELFA